jgi:predicted amidohydrolase YtcJ
VYLSNALTRPCYTHLVKRTALLLALALPAFGQSPDTIYFHGDILTGARLDKADRAAYPARVTALAVREGKIVAIGSDVEMLALKSPQTRLEDLHGAFAMPGFNDAHTHIAYAGQQRLTLDLDNVPSLAVMQQKIKDYAATLEPGQWIGGGGWDHTKWPDKTLPTRQDVDAVSGGHPVFLERTDGHIAVANAAALKAAGITDATPDPPGGKIDRDAAGHATGILREQPTLDLVEKIVPSPNAATRRRGLMLSINDALAHGVTSLQDFSDWEDFKVMQAMEREGKLPIRISEWMPFDLPIDKLKQYQASQPADDPWLHTGMLKGFMDGSLGSRTAAMLAPYSDDPGNSGIPRYDQKKLNAMTLERMIAGFNIGFHAIGDRANGMALAAYDFGETERMKSLQQGAALMQQYSGQKLSFSVSITNRYRIEHAQVLAPADFGRFAKLQIIASMQPSHLLTDMAWAGQRLGPERSKYAYAWKSFLDHGVVLAFGTDYPVESINPFRGLYSAATRQNEAGTQTFEPQEKITLNQAIYAYTQASAYAEFREKTKGVLEPGYLADFIVLDRDITQATPQELLHTKVLRTIVGGQTQYAAPSAP